LIFKMGKEGKMKYLKGGIPEPEFNATRMNIT
jgi:hypothetical protein